MFEKFEDGLVMICYLIRHGKDDDTVRGGWSKSDLTDEGMKQAESLADYINENKTKLNVERLFSSDLPRAVQTATPISKVLNLEIELVPEFRRQITEYLRICQMLLRMKNIPVYIGVHWNGMNPIRKAKAHAAFLNAYIRHGNNSRK